MQRLREPGALLPPGGKLGPTLRVLVLKARAHGAFVQQAIGLGAARWRNIDPEQRSEIMRRAVQARWAKQRKERPPSKSQK